MDNQTYRLSDSTISQIVQLIQLGILTGTDISDQIRTMRVVFDNKTNTVQPDPDYVENFNKNLQKMQESQEGSNE